mmetsp:Transcript_2796/g.4492  ORF Transcript_2796/g.4492 Transcript_2796/m.4492 type:complete len:174 (+) Transcript_2796:106-627(+)|eukprot:CAMPEP_0168583546 /NCGR_PEP_ID=MMETSP0420-20121227/2626_1 /TAXON_ID=498008 /ORGANISM="Pessonella sp." /LENGTH=173 /DNA_ID=CAMNT_0008618213 /DNA_START=67 /DNA_END=588 /DNA_ORIENTATION=-
MSSLPKTKAFINALEARSAKKKRRVKAALVAFEGALAAVAAVDGASEANTTYVEEIETYIDTVTKTRDSKKLTVDDAGEVKFNAKGYRAVCLRLLIRKFPSFDLYETNVDLLVEDLEETDEEAASRLEHLLDDAEEARSSFVSALRKALRSEYDQYKRWRKKSAAEIAAARGN